MLEIKSPLLLELYERGYIKDIINLNLLDKKLSSDEKICVYAGFDLTADSLHIGHLVPLNVLKIFKKYGHKIIVLLGGATTKIGDPSGKDETRKIQTFDTINANKLGIMKSVAKFIPIDENVMFLDNNDWIGNIGYIDFLREVGQYFSVNKMLTMESVKLRLERQSHLSFIEFNYMLLQAFDFYHLYENYNCCMQIGGSEQWGNIVNGIDLINKKSQKNDELFGMTMNLVTRSDGKKMGKSESGAVWINEDKMEAYDYYQYFRNVPDDDVKNFFHIFTDLAKSEIEDIAKLEINEQKKKLAFEATNLCHGLDFAKNSEERAVLEFESGIATSEIKYNLQNGTGIIDILFFLELFSSKGECKKTIRANGVKINDTLVDEQYQFAIGEFKIAIGKKKMFKLICN